MGTVQCPHKIPTQEASFTKSQQLIYALDGYGKTNKSYEIQWKLSGKE